MAGNEARNIAVKVVVATKFFGCERYSRDLVFARNGREGLQGSGNTEGSSGKSSQSWVENTNMTECISSLLTLIHTIYRPIS